MRGTRIVPLIAAIAAAIALVSGGSGTDPRTPPALPGMPPLLLGVAVVGDGGRARAIDAYGNVVEERVPGPAGEASVAVDPGRQRAGTASAGEARLALAPGVDGPIPLWRADRVVQAWVPGSGALVTTARIGARRFRRLASPGPGTIAADRRWLSRARPLGPGAPAWARRLRDRSLLVLRALTDRRTGASVAGIRAGWAYVWPRDAAAAALAFAASGYRPPARRIVRFLTGLDLDAAARFDGDGDPVPGRPAQGDADGWVAVAARTVGVPYAPPPHRWRDRADYREGAAGNHLANAIAATAAGPVPDAGELRDLAARAAPSRDAALAWAVRPFRVRSLYAEARRRLPAIAAGAGRYGIAPTADWRDPDPWTAPTAWTAWALAALGERRSALRLLASLRRAATPLDTLPERVDERTGLPTSTTPLGWSHAFAILTLNELWPSRRSAVS